MKFGIIDMVYVYCHAPACPRDCIVVGYLIFEGLGMQGKMGKFCKILLCDFFSITKYEDLKLIALT